jgi:hypothetical protein
MCNVPHTTRGAPSCAISAVRRAVEMALLNPRFKNKKSLARGQGLKSGCIYHSFLLFLATGIRKDSAQFFEKYWKGTTAISRLPTKNKKSLARGQGLKSGCIYHSILLIC